MTSALGRIEAAIAQLILLLGRTDEPESAFQDWFEDHPDVFRALGYVQAYPTPTLPRQDEYDLEPDFLCRRPNGLWEVVELKLPTQAIVRSPQRRPQFYAPVEQYLSQCREYARYFREASNRAVVRERYGIDVQDEVPSLLVIGVGQQEHRRLINSLLSDRGYRVDVLPYDEIVETLELARTQFAPHAEGERGFSIQSIIALDKVLGGPNVVVDVATELDRNRLTVFVDESDRLVVRLRDREGVEHLASEPLSRVGLQYGAYSLVGVQVGFASDVTVLSIEVDGLTRARRAFDPMDAELSSGAFTWNGGLPDLPPTGSYRYCAGAAFDRVLSLADRLTLVEEMNLEERRAIALAGEHPSHAHITPGTCIVSMHHPYLDEVHCGEPEMVFGPDQMT